MGSKAVGLSHNAGAVASAPIAGQIVLEETIPPGAPWSRVVRRGQVLRIIDLEGRQAVDFLCYNADNPSERYNAADTMKIGNSIFLGQGTTLYSDMENPLFTIVADSCGYHDTIGGCCSREGNAARYGVADTPNCRDNFLTALAAHGLGKKDIVANVNFFMYVPVSAEGSMAIAQGRSRPGDYVDLRAEMDVLSVISNCPQVHNPANDYNPTPVRVIVWEPAKAGSACG